MVYRFLLLSDEVDNFKREIQISSQATFLDFHKEILKSTGYDINQLYSFFICGDDWSKQTEITLIEMDTSSEVDCYVMENTLLEDFIEEEHQKLLYVFDMLNERVFFIELREIITGKDLKDPLCTRSVGKAPKQIMDFELVMSEISSDLDENFYGDDAYNDEDLDGLDDNSFEEPSEDDRF
jgi:Plasmid pRiA4b ORF-3-like protein.